MSSLRRDLFERRLWPVIGLLVVALVAVPLFMLKGSSTTGAPTVPPPPVAVATSRTTHVVTGKRAGEAARVSVKVRRSRIARNPFAGGGPKLASKPASQAKPATVASTTPASPATATPVAMVSPAPATASTTSTSPPATGTPATSTPATTTTATATTTPTTGTTPASTPAAIPAKAQSWTTYSVTVRFGKDLSVPLQKNVARLEPLPSAKQPDVMFMGVMASGRQAAFALATGVQHSGPGLCRPERAHCSAILLKARQTEQIAVATANGGQQQLILRVADIISSITQSRKVALAAYRRHSAAGLCELVLADPVSYSASTGTVSSVAPAACQNQPAAVPFRSLVAPW
jgi:hypothetical protein